MILDEIVDLLKELVILKSESHYDALALWNAHTFAIPEFDFTPRLEFGLPKKGAENHYFSKLFRTLYRGRL